MKGKGLTDVEAIGLRFGMLTIVARAGKDSRNHTLWACCCDCGAKVEREMDPMRSGKTTSCGCKRVTNTASVTHGARRKTASKELRRTYEIWAGMLARCNRVTSMAYQWYGGRGITHDPSWASFEKFLEDMGVAPDNLTLERKKVNEWYSKSNCKWVPLSMQQANKTTTIRVQYDGNEWCLKHLCIYLNIPYMRTYKRYKQRGYSLEEAIKP